MRLAIPRMWSTVTASQLLKLRSWMCLCSSANRTNNSWKRLKNILMFVSTHEVCTGAWNPWNCVFTVWEILEFLGLVPVDTSELPFGMHRFVSYTIYRLKNQPWKSLKKYLNLTMKYVYKPCIRCKRLNFYHLHKLQHTIKSAKIHTVHFPKKKV